MTKMEPAAGTKVLRSEWVTLEEIGEAILGAARDFADLLEALAPDDLDRAVPNLQWTVIETAAHVVSLSRRGDRRAASLEELADLNAAQIAEIDERDPTALAEMLISDVEGLTELLSGLPPDFDIPLHMGLRADAPTVCSYILGDLQVHGHDIATATGRPWRIDEQRAATTLLALLPAIGPWVDPQVLGGEPRAVRLDLPGLDRPVVLQAGQGHYRVSRTAPANTQRSRAQPSEVLLALARGLRSSNAAVDALGQWFLPI